MPPRAADGRPHPREQEVLALITQGLTNQEIADHVFIAITSVTIYVRAAYRKIGVTHRCQAVGWGLRSGFAHTPESEPEPESVA
ncbi:MAG: helix-turn-helix transcriptional regulator [Nocardioides sp.]